MHDFITLSSTKALFAVHKYFKETFSVTCSYSQKIHWSRFTRLFLKVKQKQFPQHAMHSFFIISIFMWKEKNVLQINLECGQHCSIDKVLHTIQKMCSQPGLLYVWQETVRMTDEDLRARIERQPYFCSGKIIWSGDIYLERCSALWETSEKPDIVWKTATARTWLWKFTATLAK